MSIEYAQGWDDAKAQVTTDNTSLVNMQRAELAKQSLEIDHLNHCISNQDNVVLAQKADNERKTAALRVAASALIDAGMYARKYGDELLNVREALAAIKEAL